MHKFFTEEVHDSVAKITGDDVKHIWKVLRLKPSDEVMINDLKGKDYTGRIRNISKQEVLVDITGEISTDSESPISIILFQGVPKGQKMDLISQKMSELGASKIYQVRTERTVPENENEDRKTERYRRIILEACKQSKRSRLLEIEKPGTIKDLEEVMRSLDLLIIPWECEKGSGIRSLEERIRNSSSIGIFVGPEGGITEEEIELLKSFGGCPVTLGPRILRTETCGFTVASILQYIAGDMG